MKQKEVNLPPAADLDLAPDSLVSNLFPESSNTLRINTNKWTKEARDLLDTYKDNPVNDKKRLNVFRAFVAHRERGKQIPGVEKTEIWAKLEKRADELGVVLHKTSTGMTAVEAAAVSGWAASAELLTQEHASISTDKTERANSQRVLTRHLNKAKTIKFVDPLSKIYKNLEALLAKYKEKKDENGIATRAPIKYTRLGAIELQILKLEGIRIVFREPSKTLVGGEGYTYEKKLSKTATLAHLINRVNVSLGTKRVDFEVIKGDGTLVQKGRLNQSISKILATYED